MEFARSAKPLKSRYRSDRDMCRICPDLPAWSTSHGLCFLHAQRWWDHCKSRNKGHSADMETWASTQSPLPSFGPCQVLSCPYKAVHPLLLCGAHLRRYNRDGQPGGPSLPDGWSRWLLSRGKPVPVQYAEWERFQRWCQEVDPVRRMDGTLALSGLRPLAQAELQWTAFHHTELPVEGARWSFPILQRIADHCRQRRINSLVDVELPELNSHSRAVVRAMLNHLRTVYFSREDSKDAGFLETEHFGIRLPNRSSCIELTSVTQRWLRDLLWDHIAHRLTSNPPRSHLSIDNWRRGCAELSAFLQAQAPKAGHDPTLLTGQLMLDFVTDERHRAEHALPHLAIRAKGNIAGTAATASKDGVARLFNALRAVLKAAMDSGHTERIGLDRNFIVALPYGGTKGGRRRPFPDDVARALASEANLERLETFDFEDRGLRDIWEALVLTGRRSGEIRNARLDCISRLGGLPMFWHDQTKVGNYGEAIRIPEHLYQRIEQRQAKTIHRFREKHGRLPTPDEKRRIALFPRRTSNRSMLKGAGSGWFTDAFRDWVDTLDIGQWVPHQARHTLATNLLKNGANLVHVKRYLGQVSLTMAEHYVHLANTDPKLNAALQAVWVAGPGAAEPGLMLSGEEPMTQEQAEALAVDLSRTSTPAEGGFCTFQPVVNGDACPWNLDCHNCDKFVLSGADLVYWHRKREQWRQLAERAPNPATADYLHEVFEPTARAIDGLEKALKAVGLLEEALALDMRRPQDYLGRIWSTAFRAQELARHEENGHVT